MSSKNYLIAGGSSGIGLELVKILAADGNDVFVLSRTPGQLPAAANIHHIALDVLTDEAPRDRLPAELHGLAYCPGSINLRPFRSLKTEHFQEDFDINVLGAVKVLQAAQNALKKAGRAGVVLFSTVAVGQGMPFHASVAAAKGAVEGLVRALAAEWAPNIRVNAIAPSLTDTPMAEKLLASPEKREASAQRHPLKRVGEAREIAEMAAFLLSDRGGWISGQVIGMDGGLSTLRV